jgi:hypothetical protein
MTIKSASKPQHLVQKKEPVIELEIADYFQLFLTIPSAQNT